MSSRFSERFTAALSSGMEMLALATLYLVWPVMAIGALLHIYEDITSKDWPSVPGTTLQASIVRSAEGPDRPILRYEYVVNGTRYRGHSDYFPDSGDRRTLEKPGAPVRVYYDPRHPGRSRVVVGLCLLPLFFLGVGAVGTLFASAIAWDSGRNAWARRAAKRAREAPLKS